VLAYFLVCGGPFGIEIAVTAGGPLPTLLAFFVMPLLWSIPQVKSGNRHVQSLVCPIAVSGTSLMEQALMTAEMSALISDNGGYVVWAQAAFGDYWGWLSGVNGSLANLFDLALYPALVAEYAQEYASISNTEVGAVTCSP
jgi:amino acid transporter